MTADWVRLPYDVLAHHQQPHCQRSQGREPRGVRRQQQAAQHDRVGVRGALPRRLRRRARHDRRTAGPSRLPPRRGSPGGDRGAWGAHAHRGCRRGRHAGRARADLQVHPVPVAGGPVRAGRGVRERASGSRQRVERLTGIIGLKLASRMSSWQGPGIPQVGRRRSGTGNGFRWSWIRQVAAQPWGYAGGGRADLLVKIRSADIIRLTGAQVADVIANDR